jgi:hypothetical protein
MLMGRRFGWAVSIEAGCDKVKQGGFGTDASDKDQTVRLLPSSLSLFVSDRSPNEFEVIAGWITVSRLLKKCGTGL